MRSQLSHKLSGSWEWEWKWEQKNRNENGDDSIISGASPQLLTMKECSGKKVLYSKSVLELSPLPIQPKNLPGGQ